MSEEEYWASEPNEEDSELSYEFMIEEPDDITLIMMPKLEFNLEETVDDYSKLIKKCKNISEVKNILLQFASDIKNISLLQNDIQYLQDRAKELEFDIQLLKEQGIVK